MVSAEPETLLRTVANDTRMDEKKIMQEVYRDVNPVLESASYAFSVSGKRTQSVSDTDGQRQQTNLVKLNPQGIKNAAKYVRHKVCVLL